MRKIIGLNHIALTLIFLLLSVDAAVAVGGKSFFRPQPLMAMFDPLSMRQQLIMNDNSSKKPVVVHLRPLVDQPEVIPLSLPKLPSSQWIEKTDNSFKRNEVVESQTAMPFDPLTIPLNDVESPDALTIPLNEIVEPRMSSDSMSYDAPDFSESVSSYSDGSSASSDLNLGNMQMLPHQGSKSGWMFSATPFYVKSFNGADLRHYFFPNGKDELVIKGSAAAAASGDPDISGTWLNIVGRPQAGGRDDQALLTNAFQSTLQVSPTYEYMGAHLHVRKQIGRYWGDVQLPVAQVNVDHGLKEYNMSGNVSRLEDIVPFVGNNGANLRGNFLEYPTTLFNLDAASAFSQSAWQYQKLSKKNLKHAGMGDVTIKIGMNLGPAQFFTKFVVPSSQPLTNEFMFQPQLGNGGHLGLGVGGGIAYIAKLNAIDAQLGFQAELDCTYLLSNSQMRTFDIIGNDPFSRYLQFKVPNGGTGFLPNYAGVNTLTKKTTVSPNGELNAHLASSFMKSNVQFGFTYSLHCTMQESLKINDSFSTPYGFASTTGNFNVTDGPIQFILAPTIATNAAANPQANAARRIGIEDLDLASATRPATATSQIAASFGVNKLWWAEDVGVHCTTGMSINHNNATLRTWLVALQIALKL